MQKIASPITCQLDEHRNLHREKVPTPLTGGADMGGGGAVGAEESRRRSDDAGRVLTAKGSPHISEKCAVSRGHVHSTKPSAQSPPPCSPSPLEYIGTWNIQKDVHPQQLLMLETHGSAEAIESGGSGETFEWGGDGGGNEALVGGSGDSCEGQWRHQWYWDDHHTS